MATLNLKHHKKITILKCSLILFFKYKSLELLYYHYKVSNIFQTKDMSGPLTPTIAADSLLYIGAITWDFYFMRSSSMGEKT